MFHHPDAGDCIILLRFVNFPIVPQMQRDLTVKPASLDGLLRIPKLFFAECDSNGVDSIMFGCMEGKARTLHPQPISRRR